eukprot:SAG31_NODE_10041_length_1193_cov_1.193962_2_plen_209_part_00
MASGPGSGLHFWIQDNVSYSYLPRSMKSNRKFMLAAVKHNGLALQFADASLQADRQIVLAAVEQNGLALQFADASLQADRQIVLVAVQQQLEVNFKKLNSIEQALRDPNAEWEYNDGYGYGIPCWIHKASGVASWEKPASFMGAHAPGAPEKRAPPPLPSGVWERRYDATYESDYYINTVTVRDPNAPQDTHSQFVFVLLRTTGVLIL